MQKFLNKITCGDCYKLIKEIPDKSVDLVYSDIPYDVASCGGGGAFGSNIKAYHKECGEFSNGIDYTLLDEFVRVCKHPQVYLWCSKSQIYPLMQYFIGKKGYLFELFTWHKSNPIPTCNWKYLSDTEYCLMFRESGTTKIRGDMSTKSKYYVSQTNKKDKQLFEHSTIKPLEVVKNHISNSTDDGDIVLDCFMGSGTTAVACKETGRQFIGFEIDEKWVDVANRRLEKEDCNGQISMFYR